MASEVLQGAPVIKQSRNLDEKLPFDAFLFSDSESEEDEKVQQDREARINLEFATLVKKLQLNLNPLLQKKTPEDAKMQPMKTELIEEMDKTCNLDGRRNPRTFIKSAFCFKYVQLVGKLARKKGAIEAYLEKAKANLLAPHLQVIKNPPSLTEFSDELYNEIREMANKAENEIKHHVGASLKVQQKWLKNLERLLTKTFLETVIEQSRKIESLNEKEQFTHDIENTMKRKESLNAKKEKDVQRKQGFRPPKIPKKPKLIMKPIENATSNANPRKRRNAFYAPEARKKQKH